MREQLSEVTEEERPLWFPEDQIPFKTVDSSKALEAGLRFRSAEETARDTLAWGALQPPRGRSPRRVSTRSSSASCCGAGTGAGPEPLPVTGVPGRRVFPKLLYGGPVYSKFC